MANWLEIICIILIVYVLVCLSIVLTYRVISEYPKKESGESGENEKRE